MKYESTYNDVVKNFGVSQASWLEFEQSTVLKEYDKGEFLVSAGDNCRSIYFVLDGILRIYNEDIAAKQYTRTFRHRNQIIAPFYEVLTQQLAGSYIQALAPSRILIFSYDKFDQLAKSQPDSWGRLYKHVLEELFIEKSKREYRLLQYDAKKRYEAFLEDFGDIASEVPKYHIASYIGVTSEAFYRLLKSLK